MQLDGDSTPRRFSATQNGGRKRIRSTAQQSVAVARVEPVYFEACRAGRRFCGGLQGPVGGTLGFASSYPAGPPFLPVPVGFLGGGGQALYNTAPVGGVSLCVDKVHFWTHRNVIDTPAGATLWGAIDIPDPASNTPFVPVGDGWVVGNANGGSRQPYGRWWASDHVGIQTSVQLLHPPGIWFSLLSYFQPANTSSSFNFTGASSQDFKGGLLIPPGYALFFAAYFGNNTVVTFGLSAQWSELDLDLE